jgi:arylsulfatase A-like enzyme
MNSRNIVVFLCDQLRPDFLRLYGCEAVPTPNLDRLATLGVVFDRAITALPLCAPARASMMTGHYPSRHRVWANDVPFHDNLEYLPRRMNELGYDTACFGKLHHFRADDAKGFQYVRQMEEGRLGEAEPYLHWLRKRHPEVSGVWNWDRDKLVFRFATEEHHEHWIASRVIDYLTRQAAAKERPFLTWVSFQGPHDPLCPPRDVKGSVEAALLPRPIQRSEGDVCPMHIYRQGWFPAPKALKEIMRTRVAYGELIVNIDHQVGRILDTLERLELFADTTFIFSADHGDLRGDFCLMEKGPFPYHGQLAVPLLVANHPRIAPGRRSSSLASNLDIPATVLEIGNAERGIGLSRSLLDLAQDEPYCPRKVNFAEYGDAVKIADDERYRYASYPFLGFSELFDRDQDPLERHNLAGRPEYANLEIAFLQHIIDFAAICKGVEIPGHDFVPLVRAGLRRKHPSFDDIREFKAAFPLNSRDKQNLKRAGLDPNYTNFYQGHEILAHYGQPYEEIPNDKS